MTTALLLAFATAFGWSGFDLIRKRLADRIPAMPLVALLTLGALVPLTAWTFATHDWRIEGGYLLPALGSLFLNVIANLAFFRALQVSPVSVSLPLLSLTPVFAAVLAAGLLGEKLSVAQIAGVALVVAGALAINLRPGEGVSPGALLAAFGRERGSQLMALVAFCWSLTLLLDKLALRHASPSVHALVLNAGVAAAVVVLLGARGQTAQLAVPPRIWAFLAFATVWGAVTLTVQLAAIRHMEVALVETLKRGVGASLAVVYGRVLYSEPATVAKLASVALMVAGVVLVFS
jgi:drug/metabolite transporter (DMT)-like permease